MIQIPIEANDWASELISGMLLILKYQPNALPDLQTYPGTFIFGDFNVEMSSADKHQLYRWHWTEHNGDYNEVYWSHY